MSEFLDKISKVYLILESIKNSKYCGNAMKLLTSFKKLDLSDTLGLTDVNISEYWILKESWERAS